MTHWAEDPLTPVAWRRPHASTLPVTGAWRPGQPFGERRFMLTALDRPFVLEGGGQLREVTVCFETWGELNADASNAILVCHALTGDAHAAGPVGPGQPTAGWWDDMIGPGRPIDTDQLYVVCANVLGGCQGSTGPASTRLDGKAPYGSSFPVVSVRDMVRVQARLADTLGVTRWAAVIGGSMGGMQALEWAVMFPKRVGALVAIATCTAATAQQIAYWSTGRRAIALDPGWRHGDYYDAEPGDGPHDGLALARMFSQITFRTDEVFTDRFGRGAVEPIVAPFQIWQRFEVERYLEYHGHKLARRFDANTYLLLTKAMDLHDIGRGRGGVASALRRVTAPTLSMGVSSDALYPSYQQRELADGLAATGVDATYAEIDSPHGHDAFLLEADQTRAALTSFFDRLEIPHG